MREFQFNRRILGKPERRAFRKQGDALQYRRPTPGRADGAGIANFDLSQLRQLGINPSYTNLYQSDYLGQNCTYISGTITQEAYNGTNVGSGIFGMCISDAYYVPLSLSVIFSGSAGSFSLYINETSIIEFIIPVRDSGAARTGSVTLLVKVRIFYFSLCSFWGNSLTHLTKSFCGVNFEALTTLIFAPLNSPSFISSVSL